MIGVIDVVAGAKPDACGRGRSDAVGGLVKKFDAKLQLGEHLIGNDAAGQAKVLRGAAGKRPPPAAPPMTHPPPPKADHPPPQSFCTHTGSNSEAVLLPMPLAGLGRNTRGKKATSRPNESWGR